MWINRKKTPYWLSSSLAGSCSHCHFILSPHPFGAFPFYLVEHAFASYVKRRPSSVGMIDIGLKRNWMRWQTETGVSSGRIIASQPREARSPTPSVPGKTLPCRLTSWRSSTSVATRWNATHVILPIGPLVNQCYLNLLLELASFF